MGNFVINKDKVSRKGKVGEKEATKQRRRERKGKIRSQSTSFMKIALLI